MKFFKNRFFRVLILVIVISNQVKAQSDPAKDTLAFEIKIPPVSEFIDAALTNSPLLKSSDMQIKQIFDQIRLRKKSWTDFVLIDANARYGLYNQVTITDLAATGSEQLGIKSNREQLNYYAGLSIRMPISSFTNKKDEIKVLNDNMEVKRYEKEQVKKDLTQLVVEEYFKLLQMKKSVDINQDIIDSYKLSLLKAEKDLETGIISLGSYYTLAVEKNKAEDNHNKAKYEYIAQFYKLQVLTGLNLLKK